MKKRSSLPWMRSRRTASGHRLTPLRTGGRRFVRKIGSGSWTAKPRSTGRSTASDDRRWGDLPGRPERGAPPRDAGGVQPALQPRGWPRSRSARCRRLAGRGSVPLAVRGRRRCIRRRPAAQHPGRPPSRSSRHRVTPGHPWSPARSPPYLLRRPPTATQLPRPNHHQRPLTATRHLTLVAEVVEPQPPLQETHLGESRSDLSLQIWSIFDHRCHETDLGQSHSASGGARPEAEAHARGQARSAGAQPLLRRRSVSSTGAISGEQP